MTQRQETLRLRLVAGQLAEQIGERIRRRRMELGLNQRQLAERIPKATIGSQTISDWERGVYQPSPGSLELLATALEVDYAYFYMREQENLNSSPNLGDMANPEDPSIQLRRIEAALEQLQGQLADLREAFDQARREDAAHDMEVLRRIEEGLRARRRRPPQAPPQ